MALSELSDVSSSPRPPLSPFGVALEQLTRHRLGLLSNQAVSDYLKARGLEKSTSPASISAYMLGKTAPHPKHLDDMLDALGAKPKERENVREAYWETKWGS